VLEEWLLLIPSLFSMVGGVIGYKQYISKLAGISDEREFLSRSNREFRQFALKYAVIGGTMAGFLGIVAARISSGKAVPGNVPLLMVIVFLMILVALLSIYFITAGVLYDPRSSARVKKDMIQSMIAAAMAVNAVPLISVCIFLAIVEKPY
jgi:uncharacterized membrane protein YesL